MLLAGLHRSFDRWKLQIAHDRLNKENDKNQHKNKVDDAMKKLMLIIKKLIGYRFW